MEANERHGLSLPLRIGDLYTNGSNRWLAVRAPDYSASRIVEFPINPRPPSELLVCAEGQVKRTLRSRPLLPLALDEFDAKKLTRRTFRSAANLLRLDLDLARPRITEIAGGAKAARTTVVCVNGNETRDWALRRPTSSRL